MPTLSELGISPAHERHLESLGSGFVPGRVSFTSREVCRVLTAAGEALARPAGGLRHAGALPVTGDVVALRPAGPDPVIEAVLPRSGVLSRRAAGGSADAQAVGANVDVVLVVAALGLALNERRLERAVTLAWDAGAVPVLVLTKADLCGDLDAARDAAASAAPGVPVVLVRASDDAAGAREALLPHLGLGRTGVLLGPSGAGKSTLVNALLGAERQLVAGVRESDGKGRHTTTSRELFLLPGGAGLLLDTPGVRELGLTASEDALALTFADVEGFASACRFRDCRHAGEPGCAVEAACEEGALDPKRVASRAKLAREAERLHRLQEHPASYVERRRWRAFTKAR